MYDEKHNNIFRNKYQGTTNKITGFFILMNAWRGSVARLLYSNLIIFMVIYYIFSMLYRHIFVYNKWQKEMFELLCIYAARFQNFIPITFLIGFYVQQVVSRWWSIYYYLPYPDKLALKMVASISEKGEFTKHLRRTVMRYVNLSTILVYRLVSKKVKDRFPDTISLVRAKLLLPVEAGRLQDKDHSSPHEVTWTPILWSLKLLRQARDSGQVKIEAPVYANLVQSFNYIEESNRKILNFAWVEFPLAYTQVANFSVYIYFLAAIFGRQFLKPGETHLDSVSFSSVPSVSFASHPPFDKHTPDLFIPIFTIVEYICYMGWIGVAGTLLNPFGDDDEDFDINYLIDRNLQVSYMIVDDADSHVELPKDPFLEAGIRIPGELPYMNKEELHRLNKSKTDKRPTLKKISTAVMSVLQNYSESDMESDMFLSVDNEEDQFKHASPCCVGSTPLKGRTEANKEVNSRAQNLSAVSQQVSNVACQTCSMTHSSCQTRGMLYSPVRKTAESSVRKAADVSGRRRKAGMTAEQNSHFLDDSHVEEIMNFELQKRVERQKKDHSRESSSYLNNYSNSLLNNVLITSEVQSERNIQ